MPSSTIHVFPFKQASVLQTKIKHFKKLMKINQYLDVDVAVHVNSIHYHVVLLNLYSIDKHIYAFHICWNNYEDYSHIMVDISMNNQHKDHIFDYLEYNLNFDNVLELISTISLNKNMKRKLTYDICLDEQHIYFVLGHMLSYLVHKSFHRFDDHYHKLVHQMILLYEHIHHNYLDNNIEANHYRLFYILPHGNKLLMSMSNLLKITIIQKYYS